LKHHQKTQKIETNKAPKNKISQETIEISLGIARKEKEKKADCILYGDSFLGEELSSSFFKKQTPLGESALMKSFEKLNYSISLYLGKKR